jgi:N-acetyl-gamma-glutamyl-phosphate reductase
MLKVAVLGGSGYTGSELVRLLRSHPHVEITAVTSERLAGTLISDTFLHFRNTSLRFEPLDIDKLIQKAELFFLCLPHKTSQETVALLYKAGKKVIDLSADYRLKNAKVYKKWYNTPHLFSSLLKKSVYGLPEIYRDKIRYSSIIANPGCYPVSAILGLAPIISKNFIDRDSIIIDSKSGTSGAGRSPAQPLMFCEVNESVKAYAVTVHRHTPEIEQELSYISGKKVQITFTPHLIPMDRGIFSTIYVRLKKKINLAHVQKLYQDFYCNEPFVRILSDGVYPTTKAVKGSNYCDISVFLDSRNNKGQTLIILSAIDNLLKGASGSAVHNMNIMYGFDETTGLMTSSPSP